MQITEYWKNRLNDLDFLPIQNVKQYHFHDVAKHEKKEFRLFFEHNPTDLVSAAFSWLVYVYKG